MTKRILIINGHPIKNSFNDALAASYLKGAKKAGHTVEEVKLSSLKSFDPVLRDVTHKKDSSKKIVSELQEKVKQADHLVIIYPTWWSTMPALLKGFFDKVFAAGFAFQFTKKSPLPKKLLKGRSARIITTMDAPPIFYRLMLRNAGVYVLKKGILKFCGYKPVRTKWIGAVKFSDEKKRTKWLEEVKSLGKKGK
ncbi:MAG: NAD(P)H-dependent oxidoreductase [Nanobdellota archaeon]